MYNDKYIVLLLVLKIIAVSTEEGYCSKAFGCSGASSSFTKVTRFVLYDVNSGEGFNLKRDVYMRMAMFVRGLAEKSGEDWHLVLPPWTKQWHWTGEEHKVSYSWHNFFDIPSLQVYSPVIELTQFFIDYGHTVDKVFILQHFPEFYEWSEGKDMDWSDKWDFADCKDHPYWKQSDGTFLFYRGKQHVKAKQVRCISFQGSSKYLESVVSSTKATSVMFDRAEVATHSMYGDANYWMCRRSMRFAKHLVEAADSFRLSYLSSTNELDGTVRPIDWRNERYKRNAKGGPYLAVHLRRKDFIYGRPNQVPSLDQSAIQIKNNLKRLNLTTVFVATDMPVEEYKYLKQLLDKDDIRTVKYEANEDEKAQFKEGGLAIIDQIIASHARYFVGTHESTFSYRIQEEREIIGFPPNTTFNRFCPTSDGKDCTAPTKWLIKYPDTDSLKSFSGHEHSKNEEL